MNIWDVFIIVYIHISPYKHSSSKEGYKGLFKICIYFLKIYQTQLLSYDYDEILNFLNQFSKREIFLIPNKKDIKDGLDEEQLYIVKLKQEIRHIAITNSLLNSLTTDYNCFLIKVNQQLKEYKKDQQRTSITINMGRRKFR